MNPSRHRATAVGLLLLAVAGGGLLIVIAALSVLDTQRAIATVEERFDVLRRASRDGKSALEGSGAGLLLSGDTTGRAAAELQLAVGAAAGRAGASVRSMQVLTPKRDGDLTEIVLEISVQGGTAALRNLTHALETSSPLLIIDELSVRRGAEAGQGSGGQPVQLAIDMKLRGFAAARETP